MSRRSRANRRIPLSKLYFGETDGFQEYLNLKDDNLEFSDVYCDPPGLEFAKFTKSTSSAFIVGGKGEGKTALLSLIKDKIRTDHSDSKLVKYISYDWDFNTEKRKRVSKALGFKLAEKRPEEKGLVQFEQEFKVAWRWFFHKIFYDALNEEEFSDFIRESVEASKYVKFFKGIDGSEDRSFLSWFPRLKDGNVVLKGDVGFFSAVLNANFEPDAQTQVSMESVLDVLDDLIAKMQGLPKDITVIIDEIELRYDDQQDWERDLKYIHDLIYISSLYIDRFRENDVRIQFLIALRQSVVIAIEQKCENRVKRAIEAYETPIQWYETGELKHCAFANILAQKVSASEKSFYRENYKAPGDKWRWLSYFPAEMGHGESFLTWLFSKTFWRPRDIVRLFKVSLENMPPNIKEKTFFEQTAFGEYVLSTYSKAQWQEMSEDLNTFYPDEIVREILNGLRELDSSFTYEDLIGKLLGAFPDDNNSSIGATQAANLLFELGMIGNSERVNGTQVEIWSFQRNEKLDIQKRLRLHDVMQLALTHVEQ